MTDTIFLSPSQWTAAFKCKKYIHKAFHRCSLCHLLCENMTMACHSRKLAESCWTWDFGDWEPNIHLSKVRCWEILCDKSLSAERYCNGEAICTLSAWDKIHLSGPLFPISCRFLLKLSLAAPISPSPSRGHGESLWEPSWVLGYYSCAVGLGI